MEYEVDCRSSLEKYRAALDVMRYKKIQQVYGMRQEYQIIRQAYKEYEKIQSWYEKHKIRIFHLLNK